MKQPYIWDYNIKIKTKDGKFESEKVERKEDRKVKVKRKDNKK